MKKTILTLLTMTILFVVRTFGQSPVITSGNNWVWGDKQVILTADSVGIEPGKAGTNVIWDYSALQRDPFVDSTKSSFMDPSKTPYWSDFPKSNIVEVDSAGTNFNYFIMNSNQVEDIGVESYDTTSKTPVKIPFTNSLVLITYPVTFGYTHSDTYAANAALGFFKVFVNGKINQTADAYGSLKIRTTSYSNVLRLKTINISKDSVDFGILGHSVTLDTSTSYTYYTPGKKSPVLTITYDVQKQDTSPVTRSKNVTFNDFDHVHTSGIAENRQAVSEMTLYPNPANGNVRMELVAEKSSGMNYSIMNQMGQTVCSQENIRLSEGRNFIDLNLINLQRGIYFVNVCNGTQSTVKKLILQ
jgi:hypothetical protein